MRTQSTAMSATLPVWNVSGAKLINRIPTSAGHGSPEKQATATALSISTASPAPPTASSTNSRTDPSPMDSCSTTPVTTSPAATSVPGVRTAHAATRRTLKRSRRWSTSDVGTGPPSPRQPIVHVGMSTRRRTPAYAATPKGGWWAVGAALATAFGRLQSGQKPSVSNPQALNPQPASVEPLPTPRIIDPHWPMGPDVLDRFAIIRAEVAQTIARLGQPSPDQPAVGRPSAQTIN